MHGATIKIVLGLISSMRRIQPNPRQVKEQTGKQNVNGGNTTVVKRKVGE